MELRNVDPHSLKFDPNNPRHITAGADADDQLIANIKAVGIIQPPVVREDKGDLVIVAGSRRVRAAIKASLSEILVLVRGTDDGSDKLRALSENVVRAQMGPVDQWKAIEALSSDHWTDDAIGASLALPVRTIKKLRLLANIHPAMLNHIATGDMPREAELRVIAAASQEEQASVWKKHKPRKGQATVTWWEISRPLEKRRYYFKHAKFGPDEESAFDVHWEEDLFAPADEDTRYTTNVEGFLSAQAAWTESNLPKNGVMLPTDDHGSPKLPLKAERVWSQKKKGDIIGLYVNPRDGAINEIIYRLPQQDPKKKKQNGTGPDDGEIPIPTKKPRADVTQKGMAMIGDYRTDALTKALTENPIDDIGLLGLLILSLGAANVDIRTAGYSLDKRKAIIRKVTEGGRLTQDLGILRQAARELLANILSCSQAYNSSGIAARFAGDAIGADAHLPNMATDAFLSCLSKAALEKAAASLSILPRQRAKDTRAALIEHVGQGHFVLPAALFAPSEDELTSHQTPEPTWTEDDENVDDANAPFPSGDPDDSVGDEVTDGQETTDGDEPEDADLEEETCSA